MSKRIGKNIFLLLLTVILLLLGVELLLRLLVHDVDEFLKPARATAPGEFIPADGEETTARYDPYLGWINRPGARGKLAGPDSSLTSVSINSKGLRDREIDYEKPPGVRRAIVLGDSFAWGYGLKTEERFSNILDEMFTETQVINMGVVGYSTDQECLLFEREGVKYQPELVILLIHDTDIFHNGLPANYGKKKPHFLLTGDNLNLRKIPVEAEKISRVREEKGEGKKIPPLRYIKKRFLARSRLYILISSRLKMMPPVKRLLVKLKLVEPSRSVRDDVLLTAAIVERLRDKAGETGAENLLVLLVPSKDVINYHLPQGSRSRRFRMKDTEIINREEAGRELVRNLRQKGIVVIDLTPEFTEIAKGGEKLYFENDNHWNRKANRIAAREIASFMREAGFN